ncbi:hypothetical protein OIE63_12335 [Streptomyces sp. NBC_01795]|uniref:hypothetical protein n=1 Tax=Streptomyces sp. NBC_01795 TaxID=2975943 RepID=UPI002DDB6B93|nr:hypothetical protein [Streptomyces sp. NBC_01795]WSA92271.1 hypothetical protein OIE63_12335 [Streptomyces sp. NBC_01795]
MRDLLGDLFACLCIWLAQPTRRAIRSTVHRAAQLFARPEPSARRDAYSPPLPHPRTGVPWRVWEHEHPLDGDAVALVRPYLLAHERQAAPGREAPAFRGRDGGTFALAALDRATREKPDGHPELRVNE